MHEVALHGAIATPHVAASRAAVDAYAAGGNAVDAALAAAAMLTVVYPGQCTIGGDAVVLVGTADGLVEVVNGSGRSAGSLDPATYAGPDGRVPITGPKSVTVPGVLSAWGVLAERWGRRGLGDALRPAAEAAAGGVPVAPGVARSLLRAQHLLARDPGARKVFLPDGALPVEGQLLRLPALAESLTTIAEHGIGEFYAGPLGESIIATLRSLGSDLTVDDLRCHEAAVESPVMTAFAGSEYLSSGANTQGTYFVQGLAALDLVAQRLGRIPDPGDEDAAVIARILAGAAADRDRLLGDSDPDSPSPASGLLTAEAIARLAALGLDPKPYSPVAEVGSEVRLTGDTVAITTADAEGTWVSLIQSAFHGFGSGIVDPGTGILLHNRGASFGLEPDAANLLQPGRRPPHTLMPVLVRRSGTLIGAHGTMGGRAQPQIHTHLALNLALGMSPAEAVARPRWVVGQLRAGVPAPDDTATISIEADVDARVAPALARAGLQTAALDARSDAVGHLQVVRRGPGDSGLLAASDPRADG